MPDHAGHGASGKLTAPIGVAALAGDIEALLAHLDIGPVDLVGLSLGGMIALELALRDPERIGRLVVANSFDKTSTPVFHALAQGWATIFEHPGSGSTVGTKPAVACLSRVPDDNGGFADLSSPAWHSGDGRWRLARPCCARHRRVRRHRTHRLARHADAFHGRQPRWDVPARDEPSHGRARATGPLRRNRRRRTHFQRRFRGSVFSPTAGISG